MNKLLANAIEAHGSLERWKTFAFIETDLASGGELLKWKGLRSSEPTHVVAHMHQQSCSISPVNSPAKRVVMKPDRVVLETSDGTLISERSDPRASFAGHDSRTPWDPFHRGYFSGYAMWSYLTTPFSLAVEGAQVWDIDPIEENGECWRGIRVVLPSGIATHSHAQEFYFGDDFLLRRQDYTLDIAEGFKVANYALEIVDVGGFKIASKRRAYVCNKKYDVLSDKLVISLDMSNLSVKA